MSDKFENGDTVFTERGQECFYLSPAPGYGHLVVAVYQEDESQEPSFGKPMVMAQVFAKAPLEKWDAQVRQRREVLQDIEQNIKQARLVLRDAQNNREQIETKFKANPALINILDFIDTPPTWAFIPYHYKRQLGPIHELLADSDDRANVGLRLLSLYGKTKGDLEWRCGKYWDGSGSQVTVHVFKTEDEARQFADEFTLNEFNDLEDFQWGYVITFRDAHSMTVPPSIRTGYTEYRLGQANNRRTEIESDLAENTKTINELSVQMLK